MQGRPATTHRTKRSLFRNVYGAKTLLRLFFQGRDPSSGNTLEWDCSRGIVWGSLAVTYFPHGVHIIGAVCFTVLFGMGRGGSETLWPPT